MIIVKLIGGLGNQLFQYSLGRKLSIKNNDILKLDLSDFERNKDRRYSLGHFNIVENFANKEEVAKLKKTGFLKALEKFKPYYKRSVIRDKGYDKHYDFDDNILKASGNFCLDGHWQSEKYFKDIEYFIRKEITLKKPLPEKYSALLEDIKENDSVSVHIRRGDYLSEKISKIYGVCPSDYYQRAVEKISNLIKNPKFFIFSDDINWAKENLKISRPAIFISKDGETKDYEELVLMSFCKHNITANSSFSWWGAWLNKNPDKIVISPRKWFNNKTGNASGLIPESWIRL